MKPYGIIPVRLFYWVDEMRSNVGGIKNFLEKFKIVPAKDSKGRTIDGFYNLCGIYNGKPYAQAHLCGSGGGFITNWPLEVKLSELEWEYLKSRVEV